MIEECTAGLTYCSIDFAFYHSTNCCFPLEVALNDLPVPNIKMLNKRQLTKKSAWVMFPFPNCVKFIRFIIQVLTFCFFYI